MSTVKPPEWGARVNDVLWRMKIPKTKLARMLDVNYCDMCSTISGYRINSKMQEKILNKIKELEAGV